MPPLLTLSDVRHEFILATRRGRGISFAVANGEILCVVGASGVGKTSLLRIALRLLRPSSGTVIYGEALLDSLPKIGVGFQSVNFMAWRTIIENVRAPLATSSLSKEEQRSKARDTLRMVSLSGTEHRYPDQLSGGMRARAAIARALVITPALLVMDEPFASVDAYLTNELYDLLIDILAKTKVGILVVTHDLNQALRVSDRLFVLDAGSMDAPLIDLNAVLGPRSVRAMDAKWHNLHESIFAALRESAGAM